MLREWQRQCVEKTIQHYHAGGKHFLCLATPGAGKTVMAAQVATNMLERNHIDLVVCFTPSLIVSSSIKKTFSSTLGCQFNGGIGAVGGTYTYQSMKHLQDEFWMLFDKYRVLVVFDEIHHCSGNSDFPANTWGKEILKKIKNRASFTLSLSGTPWRSDLSPIVLSEYCSNGVIHCNYMYGLQQAVKDSVCRKPTVVLVDNEKIRVSDQNRQNKEFPSIKELLAGSEFNYQSILSNAKAMRYILSMGCRKLNEIRKNNPFAGGVVVASDVKHAEKILHILKSELKQSAVLVSYEQESPTKIIEDFRTSSIQWIVSIGMVSEGTDIPRLQVCCHLSRVKTELYFRQVLGRILRVNEARNQDAYLFSFAEPNLINYANRIKQDLPNESIIQRRSMSIGESSQSDNIEESGVRLSESPFIAESSQMQILFGNLPELASFETSSIHYNDYSIVQFLGKYREQVIAAFDSPF